MYLLYMADVTQRTLTFTFVMDFGGIFAVLVPGLGGSYGD